MTSRLSIDHSLLKARSHAKKGEIKEAQILYHSILSSFPDNKRALQGLADLNNSKISGREFINKEINNLLKLFNCGQFLIAAKKAEILSKQYPTEFIIWNILGAINASLKKYDEALIAFKKVIELNPNYVDAYYNIGVVLSDQSKIQESIVAYQKCISLFPKYPDAYVNMGLALRKQGEIEKSIEAFLIALEINPNHAEAMFNIGVSLKGVVFKKPNSNLQKVITSLLYKKTYVRPKDITEASISLLKFEPKFYKHLDMQNFSSLDFNFQEVIRDLSKFPLFLKLMSVCPISDTNVEKLLEKLRTKLLMSINASAFSFEVLNFQSALAHQCHINEYIYNQSDEEEKALNTLEFSVRDSLNNKKQPRPQMILCLASYKSLNDYEWSNLFKVTNETKDVFTRQYLEPHQEAILRKNIPLLNKITDKISTKVKEQYELNPYPRWVNLKLRLKPAPISNIISELQLKIFDNKIRDVKAPEILIAGCGTGQHSIGTATRFKDSQVFAVDLSLSSLGYAKRKTEELGLHNIDYMQADILDLRKLDRQFDIIESAGVIHHMNDPFIAWRILKDCLKPGGLMKIALYSELARQNIVEMRKEISRLGLGSNNLEMKSFRNMLFKSDKNQHKSILNSNDLYSMSTLKDLLFHVKEHRFTINQIQKCLSDLDLKFCGFEADTIVSNFKLTNPEKEDLYNLKKWEAYEEKNPNTFKGMYQFWCQKLI